MKALFTMMLTIAMVVLLAAPNQSFAQAPDTVVVSALPPGNINTVIMGDTTATGQRNNPNRVYVLQQTGSVDTTYFFNATMYTNFNLAIIGKINPTTGRPPVIAPFINPDNSSPAPFILADTGNVTLKGLYLLGVRTDGEAIAKGVAVQVAGDSMRIVADHCVFDNWNWQSFTTSASWDKFFITNCEFRNAIHPRSWFHGIAFVTTGHVPTDTVEMVDNTFFCVNSYAFAPVAYNKYVKFEHNTIFLTSVNPFFTPELTNGIIANNIFYGTLAMGQDSAQIKSGWFDWDHQGSGTISFDTLSTAAAPPYNFTEAERHLVIENNAYFWPKALYDNWTALNDTASANGPGVIVPPVWMNSRTKGMFADHNTWPGFVQSGNDSVDPGFSSSLVTPALDSLIKYVNMQWTGKLATYVWTQLSDNPLTVFSSVPQNWATTQNYAVPENLSYTNAALQHASTDGKALGDLNWFPNQLPLAVHQIPNSVPSKFNLSNNYPNPFNPSTTVKVSLTNNGITSLKIYNVLGQVVMIVDQGYKVSGEYVYNVNMDKFASGVYFYRLQQGANMITKKMVLLK